MVFLILNVYLILIPNLISIQDNNHYYILSSAKQGGKWYGSSSWSIKRISSTSGSDRLWRENEMNDDGRGLHLTSWQIFLSGGWKSYVPFKFYIKHTPSTSLIHLKGWENGRLKFNETIIDRSSASLKRGRIGAFVYSQAYVKWSNLRYRFENFYTLA